MNSEDKFNHLNQIFNSKTNQKHIKIRQLIQGIYYHYYCVFI